MSQWVVIDDSDPSITYSTGNDTTTGQWGAIVGSIPGDVDLDNAVFQTAHVLSSNGSLSLAFNGTQVQVFGVSSMLNLTKNDHTHNPSWTCSIDNISIPINASATSGFPWTSYCGIDGLNDQPHILNINVTATQQRRFWLDYIRYIPLSTSPVANQTILVNATDPSINFPNGTDWEPVATAQFTAKDPGLGSVSMSYAFNGTGITWFGLSLQSVSRADPDSQNSFPSPSSPEMPLITVDGVVQNVTVPATNQDDASYSHILFSVDSLDPSKEHSLEATYKTNISVPFPQPPLTLDFLLVQTGPLQGGSSSPSSDPALPNSTTVPIQGHAAGKKSNSRIGAILGSVLGFFLILLLLVLFLRLRRRREINSRRARPHPSKTMDFVRDSLHPYGDDTQSPREYESFPMRDTNADDPFRAPSVLNTTAQAASGVAAAAAATDTGSRFIEDRSIVNAAQPVPGPTRVPLSRTSEPFMDSPRQTVWSIESTSAPAEFGAAASAGYAQAGAGTGSTTRSHAPSVSSTTTNPFRRMNSPSLEAAFGSTTPGSTVRSPSNPFRSGTLPPSFHS